MMNFMTSENDYQEGQMKDSVVIVGVGEMRNV